MQHRQHVLVGSGAQQLIMDVCAYVCVNVHACACLDLPAHAALSGADTAGRGGRCLIGPCKVRTF